MTEDKHHWLFAAVGWTIAAALFTADAFWRSDPHTWTTSGLGWLVAVYLWGVVMYEANKTKSKSAKR